MANNDYEVIIKDDIVYGPKLQLNYPLGGMGQYILNSCEKFSEKIFQICPFEDKTKTFAEFKMESLNLAINLRDQFKIGKSDHILTCMQNSLENTLPIAAAFYLGAIASSLDPSLSERDCSHLITLTQPKIMILDANSLPLITAALERANYKIPLIVNDKNEIGDDLTKLSDLLERADDKIGFEPVYIEDRNTEVVILFSSGTTGLPKGVCLSHYSLYCASEIFLDLIDRSKMYMHFTSLYWISGILHFLSQFSEGATRIALQNFNPEKNCEIIDKYKIEAGYIGTTALIKFIDMKKFSQRFDISSFKNVLIGGSGGSRSQVQLAFDTYPEISLTNTYGMTETCGATTGFISGHRGMFRQLPESAGLPFPGTAYKIVDPESGKRLRPFQRGEICIQVEFGMLRYYNSKEDPFDSEGFIKSGDIGYYDEQGYLYVTGRIKEMFKYQSWHVVPASIEGIIKEDSRIEDAIVFGLPHELDGYWPAAAVTIRGEGDVSPEEIEKFVAERVTERQRLRGGVFIIPEMIPTPTGKIQRAKVQELIIKHKKDCT